MSDWITFDKDHVLDSMSVDLAQAYDWWVQANPQKEARFEQLIAAVVSEFRAALGTNSRNVIDPDAGKLPMSCARHAELLIISRLRFEMGQVFYDGDVQYIIRAEIFLRQLAVSRVPLEAEPAGPGNPTYVSQGLDGEERSL